jgi:hypothetical protein
MAIAVPRYARGAVTQAGELKGVQRRRDLLDRLGD